MIDASLNEVEALAAKAARGAGLAWGLCEDAGKAARWLASCGLDWAPSLLALLAAHDKLGGPLDRNSDRQLSPFLTGTYLADLGAADQTLKQVANPLWLLPFAARVAATRGNAIRVGWGTVAISVWPSGGDVAGTFSDLQAVEASAVTWGLVVPGQGAAVIEAPLAHSTRSSIRLADWQALEALGARTYAPASAQSRATGAGAGLTDSD